MHFLSIGSTESEKGNKELGEFNKYCSENKHVFVLVFMEGCGPCNAVRPVWDKLKSEKKIKSLDDSYVVASFNKDMLDYTPYIENVNGFPTIVYINKGLVIPYDETENPDRSLKSFVKWICDTPNKITTKPIIRSDASSKLVREIIGRYRKTQHKRRKTRTRTRTRTRTHKKKPKRRRVR